MPPSAARAPFALSVVTLTLTVTVPGVSSGWNVCCLKGSAGIPTLKVSAEAPAVISMPTPDVTGKRPNDLNCGVCSSFANESLVVAVSKEAVNVGGPRISGRPPGLIGSDVGAAPPDDPG